VFWAKDIVDRFDRVIPTLMTIDVIRLQPFLFIEVQIEDVFRY
jgi:hypothetical protein